jgi:hypothetical protein
VYSPIQDVALLGEVQRKYFTRARELKDAAKHSWAEKYGFFDIKKSWSQSTSRSESALTYEHILSNLAFAQNSVSPVGEIHSL